MAITYVHKRRIALRHSECDLETIVHELVHAYLTELCLDSADLTVGALEEIFAEMMAKHGQTLLDLGTYLHGQIELEKDVHV